MADGREEREADVALSQDDREEADERQAASALVVHEAVRRRGDEELARPALSLLWSGLAGGIAIGASVLGQALIESKLPAGAEWAPLVASFGYTLGFLIVVLGQMQLFTESTLTAVIPVATQFDARNVARLLRLWGLVLVANLVGTALFAWLGSMAVVVSPEQRAAMLDLSRKLLEKDWGAMLDAGVPAGFLIAAVPWVQPGARDQNFWVVLALTYFIALGGFAHVVAGSAEAWLLVFTGETSLAHALGGMILPALIGNVIGGTGLFALLAHAQVRQEL